jgi:hypothetical protein
MRMATPASPLGKKGLEESLKLTFRTDESWIRNSITEDHEEVLILMFP